MADTPANGTEPFLTVREMVSEIRQELKEMRAEVAQRAVTDDHEERIRGLETATHTLRGVWLTLGVAASLIAGAAGLVLGVISAI